MNEYATLMRTVLQGADKSFVVFAHGTVVVVVGDAAGAELQAYATSLLAEEGPVRPGSDGGDFGVIQLPEDRGWAVTSHHPDILTLLLPDEVDGDSPTVGLGLYGRSKRGRDAEALVVVHVEDRRPS